MKGCCFPREYLDPHAIQKKTAQLITKIPSGFEKYIDGTETTMYVWCIDVFIAPILDESLTIFCFLLALWSNTLCWSNWSCIDWTKNMSWVKGLNMLNPKECSIFHFYPISFLVILAPFFFWYIVCTLISQMLFVWLFCLSLPTNSQDILKGRPPRAIITNRCWHWLR